jgi:CRP-like cAMP-binding protein
MGEMREMMLVITENLSPCSLFPSLMQASLEQLSQIIIFANLETVDKVKLQPYTQVRKYSKGEIVLHEGDRLPSQLYAVVSGLIQVTKTATTGKETILRGLATGEIFAAPALLGNGISPAILPPGRRYFLPAAARIWCPETVEELRVELIIWVVSQNSLYPQCAKN